MKDNIINFPTSTRPLIGLKLLCELPCYIKDIAAMGEDVVALCENGSVYLIHANGDFEELRSV